MNLAGGRCAVVGLGVSNQAALRFLLRLGARVEVFDRRTADQLPAVPGGVKLHAGASYLDELDPEAFDAIVVTPGMRKDAGPLGRARVPLYTEAGLVLELAPVPVVGITGSAGKTTTTTLLGRIVQCWRPGSLVGGNIGLPLLDRLDELSGQSLIVLELSSFQLELAHASPSLAAILNVRPNHLDLHGSFGAYVEAKKNIYRFQGPEGTVVLNRADPASAGCAREVAGSVVWFGAADGDARIADDWILWRERPVCPVAAVSLPGAHNRENVLAATALAGVLGVPPELIAAEVRGFTGVEHRLESVRRGGSVLWVNDSIATAPDRTEAALRTYDEPIVLLAGGYDKGIPFDGLAALICARVRVLVLFGKTARAIEQAVLAAGGGPEIVRTANLAAAVEAAAVLARAGDIVLLSPACASYDQFRNFEERGRAFKELVRALP